MIIVRLVAISLLVLMALNCASTVLPMVPFEKRVYRLCSDAEMKEPEGKVCFKRCKKYKFLSKKCKVWEIDHQDLADKEVFEKFRTTGFKLIVMP